MPAERDKLVAFLRKVLSEGGTIRADYRTDNSAAYAAYSARLDAAARERADEWQGDDGEAARIRCDMAALGWISQDRLTWMGWGNAADGSRLYGYSIWFERWDWHGVRCDRVCFHAHTLDTDLAASAVKKAAELAKRAWEEFPDRRPFQTADGGLAVDTVQPEAFRRSIPLADATAEAGRAT